MLHQKAFAKKTKKGQVLKLDLLENVAVDNVVVPSVVMEEVRHKDLASYNRVRNLVANDSRHFFVFSNEHHRDTYIKALPGESPNDRNDRAIRVAALWYKKHLQGLGVEVLLVTNDVDNARKAAAEGLEAKTVGRYVEENLSAVPELLDIVAAGREREDAKDGDGDAEGGSGRTSKRRCIYEEHKHASEITLGLKSGRFFQGPLRVSQFNPFEGYVSALEGGEDIYIGGAVHMNRAMDDDIVAVELLPEDQWHAGSRRIVEGNESDEDGKEGDEGEGEVLEASVKPSFCPEPEPLPHVTGTGKGGDKRVSGKVVGIIQRKSWRPFCGSIIPPKPGSAVRGGGDAGWALFECVTRNIPRIRFHTKQLMQLSDKRIVVVIDKWERSSRHPEGHYVREVGKIGDRETESQVLLIENDIDDRPFAPAVMECVPRLPWDVPAEALVDPHRRDLRHLVVCSVDPPGCKDIDDALHCRRLPNGNFEIGVHIADVTSFVKPGTALDKEAAKRGTSVYLVERRIDMLPSALTTEICSLNEQVDRFALSVIWEITEDAHIVSTDFTRSLIRSRHSFSYLEAQTRMDDSRVDDEVTVALRDLNKLAKIMRQRRIDRGALTLASAEVKFTLDTETLDPTDVGMYKVRESNQMIEEYMLLANVTVADKIFATFPQCAMLRRHPEPTPNMFKPLHKVANAVGITLQTESSKALADSLDRAVLGDGNDGYFNKLLRILATRCMTQAKYICSGDFTEKEFWHYGLAAPRYTHFTSPIRRYADVVVHRLLAAAIGIDRLYEKLFEKAFVKELADECNVRHHNAQVAGRSSVELHTLIYFRNRPETTEARVVNVRANGVIVNVPKYGIEGPVFFNPKDRDAEASKGNKGKRPAPAAAEEEDVVVDEEKMMVTARDGSWKLRVFDTVVISISVEEPHPNRPRLKLALLHGLAKKSW
eukprot:jgi/Mesvir1/9288/Mv04469-RA.3